jgi:hypothetical protein
MNCQPQLPTSHRNDTASAMFLWTKHRAFVAGTMVVALGATVECGRATASAENPASVSPARLAIHYTMRSEGSAAESGGALANAHGRILIDGPRYSLVVNGEEGAFWQVFDGRKGVDAMVGLNGQVLRRSEWSAESREPVSPLEIFLPAVAPEPLEGRGTREIDGEVCKGVVSRGSVVWLDSEKRVREIEVLIEGRLVQRASYQLFRSYGPGLVLPMQVRVLDVGPNGQTTGAKRIEVSAAELREVIDATLFSPMAIPPLGEKVVFDEAECDGD